LANSTHSKIESNAAWWLVIPSLCVLAFVGVLPLVTIFNYSFFDIFTLESRFWVGTEWYHGILSSERFLHSLGRSLLFSVIVLSIQIPLGIWIALLLPREGRFRTALLMILALPLMVPWNTVPSMWVSFIGSEAGFGGRALAMLGFEFDYKFNAIHTWVLLVAMDTWHWIGLVVILCYSSLSTISPAYYQAAAIDGASRLQVFRFLELPKMSGVLMMALLLRFMDSFMIYTEAFRVNAGGPDHKTTFLSLDLGEEIAAFDYGPAAARSIIYFVIILSVAWAFKTIMNTRENGTAQVDR
jgi:glycerol transport system permease protein